MNLTQPTIVQQQLSESQQLPRWLQLQLQVPAQLHYFQGHFPQQAILPGVVQLHWVAQLVAEFWQLACSLGRVEVLKFQHIILPDSEVTLRIEQQATDSISFRYFTEQADTQQVYASGRLRLAGDQ
ncbi:thioester dehydrase [Idiomarina xiamenensis]|uniref:Thioester dehydrase n=1 Tax=Idiomarina xiamenensis 10-D-4 TaxID=740709 RepID=K2JJ14_9GAMM|nr:thioester dehydrase [Idiomarina xiamenensis]EKE83416.1 thioester dehydrase [Idiomarina xiamenensis 10-D-4]